MILAAAVAAGVGLRVWRPYPIGPEQPLPFSHRVHAGDKQISCLFCHAFADRGPRAGIPALATCLLCHERIIPEFPPIQELRTHYANGRPVEWVKTSEMPDFVYFNHQMHVRKGVDCGRCHGNVKAMDRILAVHEFSMGFCVDCHREEQASDDCLICHR
ncbi:MAG: cytochrome c3 family protein [Armatimonadota bacterium]